MVNKDKEVYEEIYDEEPDDTPVEPAQYSVKMVLSALEADMIRKIRKYKFGEFTIIKQKGEPRRVILGGSQFLKESNGMKYALSRESKSIEDQAIKDGKLIDETEGV